MLDHSADLLFEDAFELYVKDLLEQRGYKVWHSVYLDGTQYTSQIDLIAIKDYSVIGVECKSHYGYHWKMFRSKDWSYTDSKGNRQILKNPVKQAKNHLDAIQRLCISIENNLYNKYNVLAPFRTSIIVCKAPVYKDMILDIQACRYDEIDKLLDYTHYSMGEEIDNYMLSLISPKLDEAQDESKERLQKHIKYINEEIKGKII